MPYKRSYTRRRVLKRSQWGKWKHDKPGWVLRQAPKIFRIVKKVINTEHKYADSNASAIVTTAGVTDILNNITQGSTANSRDGNSIKPDTASTKVQITHNASGSAVQYVRMIMYVWKNPQGANPLTLTQFLTTASVLGRYDPEKIGNYRILHDKVYTVDTVKSPHIEFSTFFNLSKMNRGYGIRTKYNSTGGGYADLFENSINCMFITSEATNGPTVTRDHRLTFFDN